MAGNIIPWTEPHYNMTSTSQQYPAPAHGGHVPNIRDKSYDATRPYKTYADGPSILGTDARTELVGHLHKETPLNVVFFSEANIDQLQLAIQNQVLAMSGGKYKIDRQSDDDLKIIMRSYYLMLGRNDPKSVDYDLRDLNSRVIGYASARIFSEVDFHQFYLKDLEEFASPISNPVNTSVYGSRTGELKSFF
jgi:hypothetical protein